MSTPQKRGRRKLMARDGSAVYSADLPNGGKKTFMVDLETYNEVMKIQATLEKELGFSPSSRQVLQYLIQYYLTQHPLEVKNGK